MTRFMTDAEFAAHEHEVDRLAVEAITANSVTLCRAILYLQKAGATVGYTKDGFTLAVPGRFNVLDFDTSGLLRFAEKCGFKDDPR